MTKKEFAKLLFEKGVFTTRTEAEKKVDIIFNSMEKILLDGENVLEMEVDERARAGLFLAMQYPSEIAGVTNAEFMRSAINARRDEDNKMGVREFIKKLDEKMAI